MIDDYAETCEKIAEEHINTLYMRDKGMKKIGINKYLKEVNNWGEIYKYIKTLT